MTVGMSANGQTLLAGSQGGPPVSPAVFAVAVLAVIALAVAYSVFRELPRRRWEAPLRKEIQARPLTFRAIVNVKVGAVDPMESPRGPLTLSVHGDMFEVSSALPPFRFLNGQQYCYRARDTTIEMVHGVLHDWIEICGLPGSGAVRIRIGRRKANRQLWDVLAEAGADPIGPPPALGQ
jgi:hypothetical protein